MKKLLALALLGAALVVAPARGATFSCDAATRCEDVTVPVPAGLTVPQNRVRVLLPAGYATSGRTYPVLYLLHGVGDTYETWTANTDVEWLTRGLDLIVVMPDGGRGRDAGWYSDWRDGSRQWETFHIDVMIPWIEQTYRVEPGRRAIAGLSMGGFGAMSYAARHPGLFRAAASFSGAVDMMYGAPVSGVAFAALNGSTGTPDDRVWGDQVRDEAAWRAHNPTDLASALAGTTVLVTTGDGTVGTSPRDDPRLASAYALESQVWQMNRNFIAALDAAAVPYAAWFYGPGYHGWPYWRDALSWALPQVMASLS